MPPHRQQAVAVIKRGGEHLLSLIEGTLDIAHIEAGKLTLHARPMEFAELMSELADMFELQAAEKGLAFRFEPAGELPELVRADERRVRQILINLLGNAIKFTASGQVTLRLRYAREFAAIEVEDTGPGMSAEELSRIFEPFARGTSAGPSAPGAGLGLTIAKMLIDLMGGEMSVQSAPGAGSVFRVRLFLPRVHEAPANGGRRTTAAAPRPRRGYEGPRRRLLVVDNEEADRELLVHLLAPLGFELRTAASGHDALDLIAAGWHPDAMFVDLAMPGIDGWKPSAARARSGSRRRPSQSSRPMPSTSGWTTTSASRPRISSSSRCATASCSTGSSAGSRCAGPTAPWHRRRRPRCRRPCCPMRPACERSRRPSASATSAAS